MCVCVCGGGDLEIQVVLSPTSFAKFNRRNTPYSKMITIKLFFCFHANWALLPRLIILLNFTFENEAIRANLRRNNKIH